MSSCWRLSWRADPVARVIADRHYNRQSPGSTQFVPPGRCLVLLADTALWVTSWPLAEYVKHRWAGAWVNTLFRREAGPLASEMIRSAVAATRWRWPTVPPLGMVTMVNPDEVRAKRDPGYCYLQAGFTYVGRTSERGWLVFQMLEDAMPSPVAPDPANGALFASATGMP